MSFLYIKLSFFNSSEVKSDFHSMAPLQSFSNKSTLFSMDSVVFLSVIHKGLLNSPKSLILGIRTYEMDQWVSEILKENLVILEILKENLVILKLCPSRFNLVFFSKKPVSPWKSWIYISVTRTHYPRSPTSFFGFIVKKIVPLFFPLGGTVC